MKSIPESAKSPAFKPSAPLDGFLHPSLFHDEESLRRGRLLVRFGVLGGAIAVIYSAFFFVLGHYWGGGIVTACGFAIMQVPWVVRRTGNLSLTGHIYGAVLVLGFSALCAVSGGLQGSAYAWLAAVPVCALLLMPLRAALVWSGLCFLMVMAFALLDLEGVGFLKTYELDADSPIGAAAHVGLLIFLGFLALLFEKSRMEAFDRLREVNARLAVVNQELTDLNRQKNEFLNIAANNLRNPLSIICDYADLLRELESPTLKDIHERASGILQSGTLMLDTIRNILDVRMIEDGRLRLSRRRCDLGELVQERIAEHLGDADAKGIALDNNLGPNPPEIYADPDAARQVIDHLISNAIKFTPHGGNVWISVAVAAEDVVVEVSDTGPGLCREDLAQLWSKFTRLSPEPTGGESSAGLGLWIVKHLAEAMGGKAHCRSVVGAGSTFSVRLPLWLEQEEWVAPEPEESGDGSDAAPAFERLIADIEERAQTRVRGGVTSSDVILPG